MRPNARVRERFELSLDGRQVAAVVVGALVVLGAVFVLGLGVGRQVASRAAPPLPLQGPPLQAAERRPGPSPAAPREAEPRLSFHDALTRGAPDPAPIAEPRPARPDPEGRAAGTALPPVAAAAPPPAAPPPAAGTRAGASPPPATRPRAAGRGAAPSAVPSGDPMAAAVAKVAALPMAGGAGGGRYAVQVGATQSEPEAHRLQKRHAAEGARIAVADLPGKGRWYRIKVGSYATRSEAEERLAALAARGVSGFVTDGR